MAQRFGDFAGNLSRYALMLKELKSQGIVTPEDEDERERDIREGSILGYFRENPDLYDYLSVLGGKQ